MKTEGQVRIPSGCAIAAVISRDGNKMSGEMITNAMKPMHDRPTVSAAVLPATVFIPNTKIFMPCISFTTSARRAKAVKHF